MRQNQFKYIVLQSVDTGTPRSQYESRKLSSIDSGEVTPQYPREFDEMIESQDVCKDIMEEILTTVENDVSRHSYLSLLIRNL